VSAGQTLYPRQSSVSGQTAQILEDGRISVDGVVFDSLSMATYRVVKNGQNGWTFWRLDEKTKQNLRSSLENLNATLAEFKQASTSVNQMLAENKTKIASTVSNFDKTSTNLKTMSDSLAKANIGQTVRNLEKTLASVDKIMADMEAGKGTLGKLAKDDALYSNFAKSAKELELLLQDLRLNPTRYVNVSLFGKKNKPYKAPVNDTLIKK
jgi:phospholipid/cholesterol/gamma-HCH transport system substrate-binding protein